MVASVVEDALDRSDELRGAAQAPAGEVESQPDLVVSESDPGVSQTLSPKPRAHLSRLGLVPAIVVLSVAAITALLRVFGPAPRPVTESRLLSPVLLPQSFKEPTDRLILLSWWLLALFGALAAVWFVRRASKGEREIGRIVHYALNGMAAAVIIAAVTWGAGGNPPAYHFAGVGIIGLFASLAGALLIFRIWTWPAWATVGSTVIVAGLTLALAVPGLLQTPDSIRDPYHFGYTSDELTAVAAGHLPLSDYIPMYSALLGFPVAPLLRAFPSDSISIVLGWVIFLQVVALSIAVAFPVLLAGKRMLAPAMLLVVMPVLATGVDPYAFRSASTYFACFPLRVVLPVACLLVAFLVLRTRSNLDTRSHSWKWVILGFLIGATALNNLDFGASAAVVVVITIVLAGRTWRECVWPLLITLTSAVGALALYVGVAAMAGREVSLANSLLMMRIFSVEGFAVVPMDMFGLHIAVVSLFVSASIFGYVLLRLSRNSSESFLYQQGLVLALVGGWSLLSMPYFAGRSFPSTLVGGYAFQTGLVVAAFLPLIWKALVALLRVLPERNPWEMSLGMVMGTLVIAGGLSFIFGVQIPSEYVKSIRSGGAKGDSLGIAAQQVELQALFADPRNSAASRLVSEGRVQQGLIKSNLTSLSTGMRSALVTNSPEFLTFSDVFLKMQCRQSWPPGVDHILVSQATAAAFAAEPECQNYVDSKQAQDVIGGSTPLVLLPAARAQ